MSENVMFGRRGETRFIVLLLASWAAVAALSGGLVYRMVRPAAEGPLYGWENGDEAGLASDPSAASWREGMLRAAARRGGAGSASGGVAAAASAPEPGAAVDGAAGVPGGGAGRTNGLSYAEQRAEAIRREQAAQRALFRDVLSGSVSWDAVTPKTLSALTAEDIAAGLAQVREMPWGPEANRLLQGLLKRWGELDARAAATYALGLDSNRAGSTAVQEIWRQWADRAPDEAIAWYFENLAQHPAMLSSSLRAVFMRLAEGDPARALVSAWQLPEAMRRTALQAIVSQASLDGGLEALRTVVGGMAPGPLRNQMISALVQEYAVYRPADAVRWINLLDDPAARNAAVNQLVSTWGYDRPAEAARWVASIPDDGLRGRSAATLIRTWAGAEPAAAGDWLITVPRSRATDPALESYVRRTLHDQPVRAMDFVLRVTDENLRDRLAVSVGRAWMAQDAAAARAYFEASTWSASVLQRIR